MPLCVVLAVVCALSAQGKNPPTQEELAAITERGRMLAEYDQAAWHATDAVQAAKPAKGETDRYIARKLGSDWTVVFGRLNEARDKFLVVYEVSQPLNPTTLKVTKFEPPREEAEFYLSVARAIDTVRTDFQGQQRPYNFAQLPVLPLSTGQIYFYVMPAQTDAAVFPLGGDVRYLIGDGGTRIIEKRQLHKTILEGRTPEGVQKAEGVHTHLLSDIPEDTDVFHVLAQTPAVPELILGPKHVYQVEKDGEIKSLGETKKFLADAKK